MGNTKAIVPIAPTGTPVLSEMQIGELQTDSNGKIYQKIDETTLGGLAEDADIADFETSTELNVRDTNNRDRANHTGTQVASTISDFDTEVGNNSAVVLNTAKTGLTGNEITKVATPANKQIGIFTGPTTLKSEVLFNYDSATGNMGIGIATPVSSYSRVLHLHNAGAAGCVIHLTDSASGATNADGTELLHHTSDTYLINRENGNIIFFGSSERGRIDSAKKLTMLGEIQGTIIKTSGYTVATLPAGTVGQRAYITDGLTPSYLGVAVGGGAVTCPVFFDGTNWIT